MRIRNKKGFRKTVCKCGNPLRSPGQRNCKECHAASMRRNRPKHKNLPTEARKKAIARAYVKVYINRGRIERKSCEVCGEKAEMHHDNYDKPLDVRWLCRAHHLDHHGKTKYN